MTRPRSFTLVLQIIFSWFALGILPGEAMAEDADGVALVGMDALQGRSAYQMAVHQQEGRWLLYVGHHPGKAFNPLTGRLEQNGTSVIDVTDPGHPRYLHHEPPSKAPWIRESIQVSGSYHFAVCSGDKLTRGKKGKVYILRTVGDYGHEIVDATNPTKWRAVSLVVRSEPSDLDHAYHTHNSTWDCASGLAIMVASKAGWHAAQIFQAFDLSDPEHPKHIRDFDLPGSEPGAAKQSGRVIPGGTWANMAHGVRIMEDRIYLTYNPFWAGTVQILSLHKFIYGDPMAANSLEPTAESLVFPQTGRLDYPGYWGAHSAEPILKLHVPDYVRDKAGAVRDILVTLSEGTNPLCMLPRSVVFVQDMTDPAYPIPISTFQVDSKEGKQCDAFTYFGPHNIQPMIGSSFGGKILLVTYFSAGLRVVDIRDPFRPVEIGHYVPSTTANTNYVEQKGPLKGITLAKSVLTNDVTTDPRGFIYISDRADTGVHILKLSGRPAEIIAEK